MFPNLTSQKIHDWSDSLLYSKCKIYGGNARVWLRKFAGLLPEVNRRQLYKRRGYASLYEFARKLAGMSDYTVDKILNLAAKLEDKPALKEQFILGNEGWTKIEKVAYIATKETDDFWAKKVSSLTQQALSIYVQEFRKKEAVKFSGFDRLEQLGRESSVPQDLTSIFSEAPVTLESDGNNNSRVKQGPWMAGYGVASEVSTPNATNAMGVPNWANFSFSESPFSRLSFPVSYELEHELRLFKQKLEKSRGQTLAWSEVMQELLKGYKLGEGAWVKMENGAGRKSVIGDVASTVKDGVFGAFGVARASVSQKTRDVMGGDAGTKIGKTADDGRAVSGRVEQGQVSRHIPAAVKRAVDEKYQHWCAFPGCRKPPDIYHHTCRFSLEKKHDPDSIVPLCKSHERLIHSGLINDRDDPAKWKILAEPDPQDKKFPVDQMAYKYYGKTQ